MFWSNVWVELNCGDLNLWCIQAKRLRESFMFSVMYADTLHNGIRIEELINWAFFGMPENIFCREKKNSKRFFSCPKLQLFLFLFSSRSDHILWIQIIWLCACVFHLMFAWIWNDFVSIFYSEQHEFRIHLFEWILMKTVKVIRHRLRSSFFYHVTQKLDQKKSKEQRRNKELQNSPAASVSSRKKSIENLFGEMRMKMRMMKRNKHRRKSTKKVDAKVIFIM